MSADVAAAARLWREILIEKGLPLDTTYVHEWNPNKNNKDRCVTSCTGKCMKRKNVTDSEMMCTA